MALCQLHLLLSVLGPGLPALATRGTSFTSRPGKEKIGAVTLDRVQALTGPAQGSVAC